MLRLQAEDGIEVAYYEWNSAGSGPPVVLQHGLAGNAHMAWVARGFVNSLVAVGRRVIAIDLRGHGASDKPRDPGRYGHVRMARDISQIVDRLGVDAYDLVGYSLGALVALTTAAQDRRVRRLIVGGVGEGVVDGNAAGEGRLNPELADALEADDVSSIGQPVLAGVRRFVDSVGADRLALAALARSSRVPIALDRITAATLLIIGTHDPLACRPERLAQAIPSARLELLDGDHLSVLANPHYARSSVAFLS